MSAKADRSNITTEADTLTVKKGNWLISKAEFSLDVESCVYLVRNVFPSDNPSETCFTNLLRGMSCG